MRNKLRFTYKPSPANYKVFVHLFISFSKVKNIFIIMLTSKLNVLILKLIIKLSWVGTVFFPSEITEIRLVELPITRTHVDSSFEFELPKIVSVLHN